MDINLILNKINFVGRYKEICLDHNDYENRLRGRNTKRHLAILKKLDENFSYVSKDKFFTLKYEYEAFELNLGLVINDGLVEPSLYVIRNEDWILYHRFDFISEKFHPGFRENFNLLKYKTEAKLEELLTEILKLYKDIRVAFVKDF
ncbi:hypothetical protein [Cellulophaga baltica]|uniref:hypothetical protein n=1 Tax=Cellulophaga baltica TaxID=76594 RepID=UPI0015F38D57|nr:hypothetical protein [Cellulophaga baltica]MBA6315175.1 hypothetical protein [Cellulophaga baltica]